MSADQFAFGPFRLDVGRRELSCDGAPLQLGSRSLDILCALALAKGHLVTKDDLMDRVWPGLTVEDGNVHVHISALRKTLDRGERGESYIITVPGRGYRLIGVQAAAAAGSSAAG